MPNEHFSVQVKRTPALSLHGAAKANNVTQYAVSLFGPQESARILSETQQSVNERANNAMKKFRSSYRISSHDFSTLHQRRHPGRQIVASKWER
jgi:hypothetical protein